MPKILFKKDLTAEEILQLIQQALRENSSRPIDFQLTRKTHQTVREGTLIQRIKYLLLVGPRDEIMRQTQFQDAANFYRFNAILSRIGIVNHVGSENRSRRIIAVHPQYVEYDEEIREGLKVMHHKHSVDNPMFVDSEPCLQYALANCLDGSTLVIDGHWIHNRVVKHGVWDECCAEELSDNIARLVNAAPGKIAHINLLGCETGKINDVLDGLVIASNLFFKYEQKPLHAKRYMGAQRNRAVYVSAENESVFNPDSLAYKVLAKLSDRSIAVTATPKILYPWPPEDPTINIGSDSDGWKDPVQIWTPSTSTDKLCVKLDQVKSVTQIHESNIRTNTKGPWHCRLKLA